LEKIKQQWTFKYEPKNFDEMVLQDNIREQLKQALTDIPNLFLTGKWGTGKSTAVKIILETTGVDYLRINGSSETSIDVVRDKIEPYATSMGMTPIKVVYINEAEQLSSHAQRSMKDLIELVHDYTRFFFITNHPKKIDGGLVSRASQIDFNNPPPKDIYLKLATILRKENIDFDQKVVVSLIKKLYPDIRGIIKTAQLNCVKNKLEKVEIITSSDVYENVLKAMLEADWEKVRSYFRSNNIDTEELYAFLFDNVKKFAKQADMIVRIGEAYKWDSQVANKEINFSAFVMDALRAGSIVKLK
jgi:replication factor C small subunit